MSTSDINLVFCTAQNVFGNGTTVLSDNWIDQRVAQDNAAGHGPVLEIRVTTAIAGGTGMRFRVEACEADGSNGVILDETTSIPVAELTAGSRHLLRMTPQLKLPAAEKTHLRVRALNSGNNTAGAISARLVYEANSAAPGKDYASGY